MGQGVQKLSERIFVSSFHKTCTRDPEDPSSQQAHRLKQTTMNFNSGVIRPSSSAISMVSSNVNGHVFVAFEAQVVYDHNNTMVGQKDLHCLGSYRSLSKTNEIVQKHCVEISQNRHYQDYTVPSLSFADHDGMLDLRRTVVNTRGEIVEETRCWVQRFELAVADCQKADKIFVVLRSMSWEDPEDALGSLNTMMNDEEEDENCDEEAVEVFVRADQADKCANHCCLKLCDSDANSHMQYMEELHARNDAHFTWMSWVEEVQISQ
eukprot:1768676-Rhodomonas_salina.1